MVISIRAELPEDFVLTVRDDSGGDILFRTSTDVEDLKEWNLGTKKEIQIDIDSETGIILGWKPITVKQVNKKKINAQRRESIEPAISYNSNQPIFWYSYQYGNYPWESPHVGVDSTANESELERQPRIEPNIENKIGRLSTPHVREAQTLDLQELRNALNRVAERMASDEERT